ncbi:GNAT family N-acetyltransferase [Paenibacillus lactis]|uniref:GNAT family N-acetyltransferase n=1 Tax=Paenibacillus lactis TaxID=228574 RepID=UPI00119FABE9
MDELPTKEVILHIQRSETEYMHDRMDAIAKRPGNPEGVLIERFGHALCLYSKTMPWLSFNTVKGIQSEDIGHLDAIVDFYRSRDRRFQIEIVPSTANEELLKALAERGLYQSGFHNSMYMHPVNMEEEADPAIEIRHVTEHEFERYATIHCRGTGLPDQGIPSVAANNRVLAARKGWRFYLAYVQDEPAAAGVMYINEGIASLTFGATLPEYRRHGLHRLLLRHRIRIAQQTGCSLVVGQCGFLSQSHRNMEAVGMRLGYVRTTWTER